MVPWVGLRGVSVVFPDHTHLLFCMLSPLLQLSLLFMLSPLLQPSMICMLFSFYCSQLCMLSPLLQLSLLCKFSLLLHHSLICMLFSFYCSLLCMLSPFLQPSLICMPFSFCYSLLYSRTSRGCTPELCTWLSIVSPLMVTRPYYITISKPLKSNPTGVHQVGCRHDTLAVLPMGFTALCRLENSEDAYNCIIYWKYYLI